MHPAENLRITFDLNLRSGLNSFELFNPDIATVSPCGENVQILEIKYDAVLPGFVRPLLWNVRTDRSAISKYVLCRRFEPLEG